MNIKKSHKAFSLIEVIFVLVILGIVSSIGSSIIVQVYESYITQNALYKVSTKTELVANQIVNRLSYAIPISTISKVTDNNGTWTTAGGLPIGAGNPPIEDNNWIQLRNIMFGANQFRSMEWIGYDNNSFEAQAKPGWSGIANYNTSTKNILNTPDSNLSTSRNIIWNLSNHTVDMNTNDLNSTAIVFRPENGDSTSTIGTYHPQCMGLTNYRSISNANRNEGCIYPVRRTSDTQLTFLRPNEAKFVSERYKLAWSAYAIVPEDRDGDNLWDLFLYYNYQPWNGENYIDGTKKLLINNVSVFKFTKNGGILQFKLCASAQISTNNYISTCKEKVVLR